MKGTKKEFIKLYSSAYPVLQRFVLAHLPDAHEAEDILQEVSLILWKKIDSFEQGTSFQAWVLKIARYEVLHARRGHARSRLLLSPELSERAEEHYAAMDFGDLAERKRALERCMDKLSASHRKLVQARYRQRRKAVDIAKESGRKENQVRTQLCRIRAALRKCISEVLGREVNGSLGTS
jgi:RNA polymerase sigma-70 factor (ECF subfamily)